MRTTDTGQQRTGHAPTDNRLARLERQVAELRAIVRRIPSQFLGGGGAGATYLEIGGGNTISTAAVDGIKYSSTAVTSVPSAYDPSTEPSTIDGIGWAKIFGTDNYVLVINDVDGTDRFSYVAGRGGISLGTVSIPVSGGGGATVTAHRVGIFF